MIGIEIRKAVHTVDEIVDVLNDIAVQIKEGKTQYFPDWNLTGVVEG